MILQDFNIDNTFDTDKSDVEKKINDKIPDVSSLVKKTDYNTRNNETENRVKIMIMTNILRLQSLIL